LRITFLSARLKSSLPLSSLMRFLAYTDMHTHSWAIKDLKKKIKEFKPDYLINGGDFAIFENGMERTLKELDKLGVPTLLIHYQL